MVTLARALSRTASSWSSSFVRNRSETPRMWTGAATVRRFNPDFVNWTTTPRPSASAWARRTTFVNEPGDAPSHAGARDEGTVRQFCHPQRTSSHGQLSQHVEVRQGQTGLAFEVGLELA